MNDDMIESLEEIYTCGSCIYLACALARKHKLSLSAYLYCEDEPNELSNYKNFNEIPTSKHEDILIDHVYARNKNLFYDVMGETKNPYAIGESSATLINISEDDLYKITNLTESELNHEIDIAYNDINRFFSKRFQSLNKKNNKLKP